jgi:hypothetical protein
MYDRKRDVSKMDNEQIDIIQRVISEKILQVITSSKEEIQAILRPYDLDIEFYYEVYSKHLSRESFLDSKLKKISKTKKQVKKPTVKK